MKKKLLYLLTLAGLFSVNVVKSQTVIFEDGFETYTDWSYTNGTVGDWKFEDLDGKNSYFIDGNTFPNQGIPKAFIVFNKNTLGTPPAPENVQFTAHTGNKLIACFNATSAPWNNDWLISPKVTLKSGTNNVSFWAKPINSMYGLEKFNIYISTTDTNTASFTKINPSVIVTPSAVEWKEYTFNLDAYAGQNIYIAIQCVSDDQFALFIDDFKVTGTDAATVAPDCAVLSTPADAATNVPYSAPLNLTWAASTGATSYDVYLDTTDGSTLVGNVTGTTYSATGLTASTTYYWKVIPKNSIGSATGCTAFSFTTSDLQYCTAAATSTSFEKLSNVTFADINNNSTSTAGYEDFTTVTGNVNLGETYTFSATGSNSYNKDHVLVWIDYNQDKDFDDAGEQVLVTSINESPWNGSITIPATATTGPTRMRVRLNDSSSTSSNTTPCGTSVFGQVEDYTINIINSNPTYCEVALNCSDDDMITNVTFAGINNTTACSTGGYGDYTSLPAASVNRGSTYPLSVTVGDGWYERVSVWIDYNNDGSFDSTEYIGEIGDGGAGVTVTEDITIPETAPIGNRRMRILGYAAGSDEPAMDNPCINNAGQFGEYEDYMISIGSLAVSDTSNKASLRVYPNPVVDVLNIQSEANIKSVNVFDIAGRNVKNFKTVKSSEINLSSLAPGTYIVKITTDKGVENVKVIKK